VGSATRRGSSTGCRPPARSPLSHQLTGVDPLDGPAGIRRDGLCSSARRRSRSTRSSIGGASTASARPGPRSGYMSTAARMATTAPPPARSAGAPARARSGRRSPRLRGRRPRTPACASATGRAASRARTRRTARSPARGGAVRRDRTGRRAARGSTPRRRRTRKRQQRRQRKHRGESDDCTPDPVGHREHEPVVRFEVRPARVRRLPPPRAPRIRNSDRSITRAPPPDPHRPRTRSASGRR